MQVTKHIKTLKALLNKFRTEHATIGFVPTMGALHEGHLSLVRNSVRENDYTVVSIYINPTQFNNRSDFLNYPHDQKKDCELLESAGCDVVFTPDHDEMYPEPETRYFEFGSIASIMEGKHRPGHFNGVAQIVTKLFDAVEPDKAYFGMKDFQQLAIIRSLTADLNYNIEIVACPIIRESDGLAMSSRNTLLSPEHRKAAPIIFKTLKKATQKAAFQTIPEIELFVAQSINFNPLFKVEYFQIVESSSLEPVRQLADHKLYTACIAVHAGKIRLIDNIEINL